MKQQHGHELIKIIVDAQADDGSFESLSAPEGQGWAEAKSYTTTFMTALILGAIAEVEDEALARVRERGADWLLAQRGADWAFNYWARGSAEAKSQPYPDDWDDTSCALIALTRVRPEVVTGGVLGHVVGLLTATEADEGGPYRTWILPADAPEHWRDVDIAVNANIAYMLHLHGVDLPNLERLADERIARGELVSPYYPSPYPMEYFLSRWYEGAGREELRKRILARRREGHWGGALETALAVSASLNLGVAAGQVAEGAAWLRGVGADEVKAEAFCYDPAVEGRRYVAGAAALTAAVMLEALGKYGARGGDDGSADGVTGGARRGGRVEAGAVTGAKAKPEAETGGGADAGADGDAARIRGQVVTAVMERLERPGGVAMRGAAERMCGRLLEGATGQQITLLPYLFRRALGERGRSVGDERLVALGMISLYGWIAYTIYDDFLDEEGDPALLSLANVALRELVLALHAESARIRGFGAWAWPVLDRQEAANAWEVTTCRARRQRDLLTLEVPDFGDLHVLAERSMGHALGCLSITMELGFDADSDDIKALERFFYHFLIARQLSDDARDWKEDLRKGQINAVGAHLLKHLDRRGATVQGLYARMEERFWERGITEINGWIFAELTEARRALKEAAFVERPEVLEALLAPIEEASREAERQRRQAMEFLQVYRPL